MGTLISFETERNRRLSALTQAKPVSFARLLINWEAPEPALLALFSGEPQSWYNTPMEIKVDLGITAEPYSLKMPMDTAFRLDDEEGIARHDLNRLARRVIIKARWRSSIEDVVWADIPDVRSAVLNSTICLLRQLNTLRTPLLISRDLEVSTELCNTLDTPAFSQLVLTAL